MTTVTRTSTGRTVTAPDADASACRLYGIVPAGTRTVGPVRLVTHRDVAALVGPASAPSAGPTRQDLLGYAEVLDRLAVTTPVLPMRYGTVLPSAEAVRRDVLAPHHDAFAAALSRLAGRAQFTVRARYLPDVALREVLAERPDVRRLHQRMRARPAVGSRMRLGEVVAHGIAGKRRADAEALARALGRYATAARVRLWQSPEIDPIGEVAFLVELARRERFEAAAERLARDWCDRVRLRLLGPMAAYHFVSGGPTAGRGRWG